MTKEELLALGLTEEQTAKVMEGYKGYIPKSRFDEVNEAKKKAESTVAERDRQLEELKKNTGDSEALKNQIAKLQNDNKIAADQYAKDLKALQVNTAVERELTTAGAKNLKAVKALLELDNAELDGETVKGLSKQIEKLKQDDGSKFLFADETAGFKGVKAGNDNMTGGQLTKEDFNKMGYKERAELFANNQEVYNALSKE